MAEPVMQQAPQLRLGQGGMAGRPGSPNSPQWQMAPQEDATFNALMKIGQQVMQPLIEKRQNELFLQGAQRVAQGEALKDIVDEQPWYGEIFGPSASVQGARTVAQIAQVDKYNSALIGDMENLQKISPDEIGKVVNAKMTEFLTGDPVADAAIQQKMVEASGTFYNAHAKANYKYVQTTMQTQVTDMMVSSAGMIQNAARQRLQGTVSEKDWAQVEARAAAALQPIAGQSAESYWAAVEASAIDAMVQGNHHFVSLIEDAGLIAAMPVDQRKKVLDARTTYEKQTREKEGYLDFGVRIGQLKGMAAAGQLSTNQIAATVDEWNQEFSAKTGIRTELFTRDELTAMIAGNYKAIYKRQEAHAKESTKHQQDIAAQQQIVQGLQAGAGNLLVWAGGKKDVVDTTFYSGVELMRQNGGDWTQLAVQNFNEGGGYVNPYLQNELQSGMRASKMEGYGGQAFDRSYQEFKALATKEGGKAAALKYLGEEDGLRMMKYDQLVSAGQVTPEIAYQAAFGEPIVTARRHNDKEVASIVDKQVEKLDPGFWSRMGGAEKMTPSAAKVLANATGKYYDLFATNLGLNEENAVRQAIAVAKSEIDVVGSHAYQRKIGQPAVSALIGADPKVAGEVFNEYIAEQARKSGVKYDLPGKKKDGGAQFGVDLVRGGPLGALSGAWDRTFGEEADVHITRLADKVDPDTGLPYANFAVYVSGDGDNAIIPLDSRDLRKYYESSKRFK